MMTPIFCSVPAPVYVFVGDVTWQQMHPVVALCLGFRVKDGKIEQDLTVEPSGEHFSPSSFRPVTLLLNFPLI